MEWCVCDINKCSNVTPHIDLNQRLLMHCWCHVLMLCLQRVMKLVSWMACWRHCSPARLSGEREDHGKQVLVHKQSSKSSQNMQMFQSVLCLTWFSDFGFLSHTFLVCIPYWNICSIWDSFVPSPSSTLSPCFCRYTTTDLFVLPCLCSICCMAQRLWVVVVFSSHGYRGAKPIPPMAGTTTKEEGGCQGWVWAAGYLREEQLLRVWLWNRKI